MKKLALAVLACTVALPVLAQDNPFAGMSGKIKEGMWQYDMQMGAIRDAYGYEEAIRLAIVAGVDILTIAQQKLYNSVKDHEPATEVVVVKGGGRKGSNS